MFRVNWSITNLCNNNCTYCFQDDHSLDYDLTKEKIIRVIDNIKNLNFNEYSFTLTGGEPTLNPNLSFILKKIFEFFGGTLKEINFITNCTQPIKYFDNLINYMTDNRFFIRLSFHPQYFNNTQLNLLEYLINKNINIKLSILFDNRQTNKVKQIINKIDKYSNMIDLSLRRIFNCDSIIYSKEDLIFLKLINQKWNTSEQIYNTYNNKFKNKYCSFGKDLLIINSNLTFSSSYCNQTPIINIPIIYLSPNKILDKINSIQKCRQSCCTVPTDLLIPKFNTREEAKNYLIFN